MLTFGIYITLHTHINSKNNPLYIFLRQKCVKNTLETDMIFNVYFRDIYINSITQTNLDSPQWLRLIQIRTGNLHLRANCWPRGMLHSQSSNSRPLVKQRSEVTIAPTKLIFIFLNRSKMILVITFVHNH